MNRHKESRRRIMAAMIWIDSPERTKEEVDRWLPSFKRMFDKLTKTEKEMRHGNVR